MAERRTVIVTRPQPDADALADELRRMGHEPVLAPVLEIRPRRPDLPPADTLAGLIVTSGNALPAIRDLAPAYRTLPVWAVGAVTGAAVEAAGLTLAAPPAETAAELAERIREGGTKGRLLWLSGEEIRLDLRAALAPSGIQVERVVVYAADAV